MFNLTRPIFYPYTTTYCFYTLFILPTFPLHQSSSFQLFGLSFLWTSPFCFWAPSFCHSFGRKAFLPRRILALLAMQPTDDWRTAGIPRPVIPESVHRTSRALQITSGNAQTYNLENLKAEEVKTESGNPHLPLDLQNQSYPPPPTLPSNAPRTITATQRLEQRRLHRTQVAHRAPVGSGPPRRAFLKSKKYLTYRTRQRTDTGDDGEPIWPDELEDVFQDGAPHTLHIMVNCANE
jgi:hypothetical protein